MDPKLIDLRKSIATGTMSEKVADLAMIMYISTGYYYLRTIKLFNRNALLEEAV